MKEIDYFEDQTSCPFIIVNLFDHDSIGKDTFLGMAKINVGNLDIFH